MLRVRVTYSLQMARSILQVRLDFRPDHYTDPYMCALE